MPPPPRITRSQSSLILSPTRSERPHPTLADVPLPPRRRIRDGSSSRRTSISDSSSSTRSLRSSSRARGASTRESRGRNMSARILRHRPSPLPVFNDEDDSVFTNDFDDDSFRSVFSSGSLSPPPPEMPLRQSSPIEPPISRAERRELLAILDQVNDDPTLARPAGNDPRIRPISQPFPLERSGSASGSASTSTSDPESAARRYTTQEKGKGRAVLPSPIAVEDDEGDRDESIQVIGVRIPENGKRTPSEDVVVHEAGSFGEDDQRGLGSFTCPVCFCAPERAVMTLCGHILCAKCLLDSLTAAIKRNPNPHPVRGPPNRSQGRGRGRGGPPTHNPGRGGVGGANEWTVDTLKAAWFGHLDKQYEWELIDRGVEKDSWDAIKAADPMAPKEENVVVKEELKGLWTIDGIHSVVEGECPVCRKAIPGGFGPPKTGIGGFIPLEVKLGGLTDGVKKRR